MGNHTQLNGGVIASTATPDDNALSTQTFGYTNLQNTADYSGSTIGAALSGSSPYGSNSFNLTGGPQSSQTGNSASGTTYAAVSPGTITVRGDAGTGQDSTAGLSRDTSSANGSVQNTFSAQTVANNMAIQQEFGQMATVAVGQIADQLEDSNPLFEEGGVGRDALHAAVAAISAAISGGSVTGAVGGSITGDELQLLARPIINQAISQLPADAQDAARNALNDIVASAGGALGGALAGGGSQGSINGAGSAANNEIYNQQLDPTMKKKSLLSSVCAATNPACGDSTIMTITNAEGATADAALSNMNATAPYIAGAFALGVAGETLLPLLASIPGAPIFGVDGLLGSSAWASPVGIGTISGAVNATSQYVQNGSVNPVDVAYAALAGGLGTQGGFVWNVGVNAVTGAFDTATNNAIYNKSDNIITGSIVNAGAATIGYGVGLAAQSALPGTNWFIPNNLPTIGAGLFGAAGSEAGTAAINHTKEQVGK